MLLCVQAVSHAGILTSVLLQVHKMEVNGRKVKLSIWVESSDFALQFIPRRTDSFESCRIQQGKNVSARSHRLITEVPKGSF